MGEREPQPEKWLMYDNCDNCEQNYLVESTNSFIVTFSEQPDINRLITKCTNCGTSTLFFIIREVTERAIEAGIRTNDIEGYAPKEIYENWHEVIGEALIENGRITPPKQPPKAITAPLKEEWVSPRQQRSFDNKQAYLGYLLDHNLIDFNNEKEIL